MVAEAIGGFERELPPRSRKSEKSHLRQFFVGSRRVRHELG
jgi:hypothetical protein